MPRWRNRTVNTPRPVNQTDPLNRQQQGWWLGLPNRQSPTTAQDLLGRRNFTMQGGALVAKGGARPGGLAAGYDLSSATAMGSALVTPPTAALTMGCWFRVPSVSAAVAILGWNNASDGSSGTYDRVLHIEAASKKVNFFAGGQYPATGPAVNDNVWHFAVATIADDATTARTYVDGVKYQGGSGFSVYNGYSTPYLCVGRCLNAGTYLQGYVDDWFYYDRCMSDAEVYALYVASKGRYLRQLNWLSPRVGVAASATRFRRTLFGKAGARGVA